MLKKRGRPSKNVSYVPSIINFTSIETLKDLSIDEKMLETMKSGLVLDTLISHESGVPCATNIMVIGDPGVGKTTVLLDLVSSIQNKNRKCLFISWEMGKKQMYKYTQRFPQFGNVKTLFPTDFINYNPKDVFEQVLNEGWDLILIDSIAEVVESVRDENGWDRKTAESWFVDICVKQNNGLNKEKKYSSFLAIQQVTKAGEFVGSNKLKHMFDASAEMRRESEKDGGGTYMMFNKNRNGEVGLRMDYSLSDSKILYSKITVEREDE
jgi:predicted ATP-dependent serine protease